MSGSFRLATIASLSTFTVAAGVPGGAAKP